MEQGQGTGAVPVPASGVIKRPLVFRSNLGQTGYRRYGNIRKIYQHTIGGADDRCGNNNDRDGLHADESGSGAAT